MLASQDKLEPRLWFHNYFPQSWQKRIKLNVFSSAAQTVKIWTNQHMPKMSLEDGGLDQTLKLCLKT